MRSAATKMQSPSPQRSSNSMARGSRNRRRSCARLLASRRIDVARPGPGAHSVAGITIAAGIAGARRKAPADLRSSSLRAGRACSELRRELRLQRARGCAGFEVRFEARAGVLDQRARLFALASTQQYLGEIEAQFGHGVGFR